MAGRKLIILVTGLAAWSAAVFSANAAESTKPAVAAPAVAPPVQLSVAVLEPEMPADRLYRQLIDGAEVEPCVKGLALVNLINERHAAGQWSKVLEATDQFAGMFPEMMKKQPSFGSNREEIQWYVTDAQKHLAAEKPLSSAGQR